MGNVVFFDKRGGIKMINISEAARFFLSKDPMTHLKLQKLCYYAQAWHLAVYGTRLFDEEFQAWLHGPVSPSLYQRYKQWGTYEISQYTGEVELCDRVKNFLEMIYGMYGAYSGPQLENLTHSEDPWKTARNGEEGYCTNVISDDSMLEYYRNILDQRLNGTKEE